MSPWFGWTRAKLIKSLCALSVFAVILGGIWIRCGPLPPGFLDPGPRVSTEVVDRRGAPLYEALSEQGGRGRALDPRRLPRRLVQATMAAEDRRFEWHPGVDPLAIVRAVWHGLRAGRPVEGGSTLTQQAAKILSGRRRTLPGKLREIVLALRLERKLSKAEILALYMSVAPYGNQLVGAEAASRAYFGCAPQELTPAQAAFLAGLPERPTAFDPYRHLPAAVARQQRVLSLMRARGFISEPELAQARAERLRLVRDPRAFAAPHFVERVLASAGPSSPRRIETTLDKDLQGEVRGILEMHRERLERHGAHNVAVAVLDNATFEWLAWEGSGDFFDPDHGGAIDGVVSPRQPGSALKPFTYALAFEDGFTPATVLPDLPSHFPTAVPGVLYSPRNYDGVFRGPLRARPALAGSENVPAVWTLSQVGVPDLLRLLRRAGFSTLEKTPDHYGFGLTMGDAEVRLDELVAGYAAFARGGRARTPRMVRAIVGADGAREQLEAAPPQPIVSERAAFWITDILSDSGARAYVFGSGGSLDFPFPVAVKTGTSQAYRDNWTVGFTREVTVGVWVGNFDRAELRSSSGVTGAAPIFHDVMLAAERRVKGRLPDASDPPLAAPPPGLEPVTICLLSGHASGEACPAVATEWLPAAERRVSCAWHRRRGERTVVVWPASYRSWARSRNLLEPAGALVASHAAAASGPKEKGPGPPLRIVNPPPGAIYLRDPTLRADFQTLPLRAVAESPRARLTWTVDGHALGTSGADASPQWPLSVGGHVIAVTDDEGRRDQTTIVVR
jgi:penicillin-binding protein 1C